MSSLQERFAAHFGQPGKVIARAPGRLEILGNHTDYNEGWVLSCAVHQAAEVVLSPAAGDICRLKDFRDGSEKTFDPANPGVAQKKDWSNYVKGVIVELAKRGCKTGAFDAAMLSSVPLSAGMSSSAALETAFGLAIGHAFGFSFDKADWARIGQGVENNYLGLSTGLLDQFSSLFGQENAFILSDFRSVEVIRTVGLPEGYEIVVVNSMIKHNLVDSEYNVRRQDCESAAAKLSEIYPDVRTLRDVTMEQLTAVRDRLEQREFRRAAHVVGECERVQRAVAALDAKDVEGFGKLWFESHESSRVNFENSIPEMDYLVELAQSIPGCVGARLSGGGFGGITIHLVQKDAAESYGKRIAAAYQQKYGIVPEVIYCRIGGGASVQVI